MTTDNNQAHHALVSTFRDSTPIEIRFHANHSNVYYQLLASSSTSGVVHYTLHLNPRGNYSMALTYLSGQQRSDVTLPMKSYEGWQQDVLAWITSLSSGEKLIYTVDEVY